MLSCTFFFIKIFTMFFLKKIWQFSKEDTNFLYDGKVSMYKNFKFFLNDKAFYGIKAKKILKTIIKSLKNVTCLCHGFIIYVKYIKNTV